MPVHIPFYISNINQIFTHFWICKIQNKLIPTSNRSIALTSDHPIRMLFIQLTFWRNHLRLKPYSKFYSFFPDFFSQFLKTFRKFLLIFYPISQGCCIAISSSKPSIIHNKKLYSCFYSRICKLQHFFFTDCKIHSFPAV